MSSFKQEGGDWTRFRQLGPHVEIDFHVDPRTYERPRHPGEYDKRMSEARDLALQALKDAYNSGTSWVILVHGSSTSRPGRTTIRSVIRDLMKSTVSVSHTAYTDPAVDRYASGCPNDDPPNNGALC